MYRKIRFPASVYVGALNVVDFQQRLHDSIEPRAPSEQRYKHVATRESAEPKKKKQQT